MRVTNAEVNSPMRGEHVDIYINGKLRPAHSSARIPVINPADEREFATIPDGDKEDVAAAVDAAREAFRNSGWPQLPPSERAKHLRRLARAIDKRAEQLGAIVTAQIGMPFAASVQSNGGGTSKLYDYYAEVADQFEVEFERVGHGLRTVMRREPVGVAALIVPWNGPQGAIAWKLAPALAAGCTTVIKPPPEASLDSYLLAGALDEAGIPPGVVNIVFGGRETGALLASHPGVDKVSFTGSTQAGRQVALACAERFARVTLELGGKSGALLLDDADLDTFLPLVAPACIPFSGQICHALTRVIAPRERYDKVVEGIVSKMAALVVGHPLDPTTQVGPLVAKRQRDRVEEYIASGRAQGAKVVAGGGRPPGLEAGYYIQPTVFRDVDSSMRIAQEEIFGPVVSVIPYDNEEEALAICNGTAYGLGGAVFTSDPERGMAVARRIEAGVVGINRYTLHIDAPFGGIKGSGIGRELGPEGLSAFLEAKSIFPPQG
ncbi:aldehyde dehydrogenase [Ensifer sp. BR816]|uniref:aldehyde dehydrogenase n=1 Tax=Rhizobium sp. (strain BR816) TaxID=1057002 RepID=UPI0018DF07DC|nr:aldehyde dehydrogenase [Ensifer sp. BR816]